MLKQQNIKEMIDLVNYQHFNKITLKSTKFKLFKEAKFFEQFLAES